ncbi:MAG: transcription-repair coupling factor, partial [Gammaproteobacteria bacterium]|nr:transcription-repair coupling factor [Gammaproteobacteria bacterium]
RCARDDVPRGRVGDEKPWRILFITEGAGRREIVLDLLTRAGVFPVVQTSWGDFLKDSAPISMLVAPLEQGLELTEAKISVIVESQLFGELGRVAQRAKQAKSIDPDVMIRDLIELQVGAPVVHLEHGVGRYLGLKTIEIQAVQQDFMELLYADGDKIFVPVTALHQVTRYTGVQADHAPLNRLGSGTWQREKKKATEVIHDLAVELLEIYAKRQIKTGTAFHLDASEYERFVSDFAFIETADQDRAIQDILKDLQKETAMERLICGDVGFGKTEVAMRAAFLAVQNDKQVCVLVPTTLLASQHYETFCERFASFPIQVRILSRFQQAKECTATIEALKKGTVDIVIGTHKLLNQSLVFKDLGLLIIDEEHRFGVKQKEKIKAIKNDVHCLTMTATPIPRTLNMAMSGLRDISLIATPPAKRLAIKTFWREKNPALVREAVLREIFRGGQVFYVHNEVDSIQRVAEELQTLLPEALVRFAHGQMSERLLERIMSDFYHQRFNVLVCTTIIETGIDIPTANTLMIDRADKFGLAQLHQLRGRVGRSHHQAYAYLFTPAEKTMTSDAVKRLEAIVSLEDLGAGFILATQDLEIRGAGELLGDEQSGNMHAIGFTLYMELLDRAVTALREGKEPALLEPMLQGPEIDVYFSALLPEDYVGDIHTRLILYKRISNAVSEEDLERIQVELIDRFGLLPIVVKHLFQVTQLKLKAKPLGIHKIQLAKGEGKIGFAEQPNIRPEVLIELIQKEPTRYRLQGPKSLRFQLSTESVDIALRETAGLFERLTR